MNETETRAELIDPALAAAGWGTVADSTIKREQHITDGRIQIGGRRGKRLIADYVLIYRGVKLAVVEAKSVQKSTSDGVAQAKKYAQLLDAKTTFATNGKSIYQICMTSGQEGTVERYPTPDELWQKTFPDDNEWRDTFHRQPLNLRGGAHDARYYQERAINRVMAAIANKQQRILLTMATGTGKTGVAFEIVWKLFHTRWNLQRDGSRRPRILFLADRNTLANQAFNAFSPFPDDALVRVRPDEIAKTGRVPTNGSIFFTIFQTFLSGPDDSPYFGEYPPDYFDLVIVDECHRGGASDESSWRDILNYFSPAVQLGLTATPKRKNNVDTYSYFGEPVDTYSLKDGINDGFLTPFRVQRIKSSVDEYIYSPDDTVLEGEVEHNKLYKEADFNRTIEIEERERYRVRTFLQDADPTQQTIVFCQDQKHAALVRDLINQEATSTKPDYCVRVTADEGKIGDEYLKQFRTEEPSCPTILTSSQKLTTGVDARNVRNIVLLRQVNDIIEFKQIVGRGTRLADGKEYFTIYDFVDIFDHFSDPEWDGPPEDPPEKRVRKVSGIAEEEADTQDDKDDAEPSPPQRIRIALGRGKTLQLNHFTQSSFWGADGQPMSAEDYIRQLFGKLPDFYTTEQELREIWSDPATRKVMLQQFDEAGINLKALHTVRDLVADPASDLFDVLEYISFEVDPITRAERVEAARESIFASLSPVQSEFVEFVLSRYIDTGTEVLDREVLPDLLRLKYDALEDAIDLFGNADAITKTFTDFQRHLYADLAG